MDISKLATKDNADSGIWFTVELYGEEQDFQLRILGDDSDTVSKHIMARIKKAANRPERKKPSDEDLEDVMNMDTENVLVRIAGIRGIKRNDEGEIISYDEPLMWEGKVLEDTKENYALLVRKIPELKTFVSKVSKDRTNFLSGGKEN